MPKSLRISSVDRPRSTREHAGLKSATVQLDPTHIKAAADCSKASASRGSSRPAVAPPTCRLELECRTLAPRPVLVQS